MLDFRRRIEVAMIGTQLLGVRIHPFPITYYPLSIMLMPDNEKKKPFRVEEATIAELHQAIRDEWKGSDLYLMVPQCELSYKVKAWP